MNVCFFLVIAASFVMACKSENPESRKEETVVENDHIVFNGISSGDAGACWNVGDEISICDAEGHRAIYKAVSAGKEVKFVFSSGAGPAVGSTYTAWSPASAEGGAVPSSQTVAPDALHDVPMKAESKTSTLEFNISANLVRLRIEGPVRNLRAVSIGGRVQMNIPESLGDVSSGRIFRIAMPDGTYNPLWIGLLASSGDCGALCLSGASGIIVRGGTEPQVDVAFQQLRPSANLSAYGAANCYIAGRNGAYRFYAGGKGKAVSVDVLWKQNPKGEDRPAITPPVLFNDYIYFCKGLSEEAVFEPSNAVIAARDNAGEIVWSWHIWSPEETASDGSGMTVSYVPGKAMDRNLGALSKTPGDTLSRGFYYQWGRKDPFPLWRGKEFPSVEKSSAETGTVQYVTSHPMTFVKGIEETCFDWHYTVQDTTVWKPAAGGKGALDPCPPGWRVPDGAGQGVFGTSRGNTKMVLSGFWAEAFGTALPFRGENGDGSSWWNQGKCGMTVPSSVAGSGTWFPAAGYIDAETGGVVDRFVGGALWTRGSEPVKSSIPACSHCMVYGANGRVRPTSFSGRAAGMNVRCVKE